MFFAQETLKQAAGEEFEPKIYAAIISAKVMIVIGTKEEYFNAVWVKNEWSRFSELIEHGEDKTIIPVFDNFDIGKLPNRLSKYQALQKSDLDFLNVLMQTVEKRVDRRKSKIAFDKDVSTEKVALERGYLALEDGQFSNAERFFEKALDTNPHSSEAYFGKLMVELKARKQEDIVLSDRPLNTYNNFVKAVRFADQGSKAQLFQYEETVQHNCDKKRLAELCNKLKTVNSPNKLCDLMIELKDSVEAVDTTRNSKEIEIKDEANKLIDETRKRLEKEYASLEQKDAINTQKTNAMNEQIEQILSVLTPKKEKLAKIENKKHSVLFDLVVNSELLPKLLIFLMVVCVIFFLGGIVSFIMSFADSNTFVLEGILGFLTFSGGGAGLFVLLFLLFRNLPFHVETRLRPEIQKTEEQLLPLEKELAELNQSAKYNKETMDRIRSLI